MSTLTPIQKEVLIYRSHVDPHSKRESLVRVSLKVANVTPSDPTPSHLRFSVEICRPAYRGQEWDGKLWTIDRYAGRKLTDAEFTRLLVKYSVFKEMCYEASQLEASSTLNREILTDKILFSLKEFIPTHTRWVDPYRPHMPYVSLHRCDAGSTLVISRISGNSTQEWFKITKVEYVDPDGSTLHV